MHRDASVAMAIASASCSVLSSGENCVAGIGAATDMFFVEHNV